MEVSTKLIALYNPFSRTETRSSFDLCKQPSARGLGMGFYLVGFPISGGFSLPPTPQDRLWCWLAVLLYDIKHWIYLKKSGEMQRANNYSNIELLIDFLKVSFVTLTHLIEAGSKNNLNPILDV